MQNVKFKNHFIIVGPGRSGSTWLYKLLSQDDRIGLAKNIKETQFFNDNYPKGINSYYKFFNLESEVTGEISNLYFHDENVPERIHKSINKCKIVILVRNPVDRLISIYNFKIREGNDKKGAEFTTEEISKYLRIDIAIQRFQKFFSKEDILFFDFHKIKSNGEEEMKKLYKHIGLDYRSLNFPGVINESIIPKMRFFGLVTKQLAVFLRKMRLFRILTFLKRQDLIKNLLFVKKKEYPKFTNKQKNLIIQEFQIAKKKVQDLTGIKTENWRNYFENTP